MRSCIWTDHLTLTGLGELYASLSGPPRARVPYDPWILLGRQEENKFERYGKRTISVKHHFM